MMNTTQTTTADDMMNYIDDLAFDLASQQADRPGVYQMNGAAYMVKWNQTKTRLYAKVRTGGRFEYAAGAIYRLTVGHRLTIEQAEALSLQVGACMICGRELTVKESVARGIGPVCRKRYGAA